MRPAGGYGSLGIRIALCAQRQEVLQAALGRALKLLALGSAAVLCDTAARGVIGRESRRL